MTGGTDGGTRATTRTGRPLACVVVNPSKPRVTAVVHSLLEGELREAGYAGPVWLETSVSEPGTMQARLALAAGARLVVAAGGDGTVRSVAAGLAGTGAQMGIVPLGTANLAARNLGVPVGDARAAAQVVARGVDLPADLAWVRTEPWSDPDVVPDPALAGAPRGRAASTPLTGPAAAAPPDSPPAPVAPADSRQLSAKTARAVRTIHRATRRAHQWTRPTLGDEHACMVVAGIGFDAGLVASTRPALKARVGWGAYALAAMENLGSPRMDLVLSLRDEAGARRVERLRARNLLVANGGRLPAGITLLPQARTDDGMLDVAAIDTVAGLAGWSSLARQVLPPYAARYSESGRSLGRVMLRRGGEVAVRLSAPALVEVDGDLLAPTQGMRVRIDPGALLIRRPAA
ncbi:diacylglycerol/lipid kinase family protein [Actinomyces oris]|uniref:Diacylglycerol kinase family protein n=1 Tax=Actinomyces oris TaxID=544580 RepID=A0AAW9KIM9_9ACTO|nr:diacylglycerol kinase family protein [Actinomyces oris]MEA1304945.1 diacylglycerol kinase family protein [Actinomyces oris]OLO66060.1 diacylglycerol kinase [Actinomyces oris]